MKQFLQHVVVIWFMAEFWSSFVLAQWFDPKKDFFPNWDTILTDDIDKVVSSGAIDGWFNAWLDVIADWCGEGGLIGILCNETALNNAGARETVAKVMADIINYALAIVGLIALVYLLYHAFLTLTAGGDDERAQKWFKGIKYALIALVGIALSPFIIGLVLYLVFTLTN